MRDSWGWGHQQQANRLSPAGANDLPRTSSCLSFYPDINLCRVSGLRVETDKWGRGRGDEMGGQADRTASCASGDRKCHGVGAAAPRGPGRNLVERMQQGHKPCLPLYFSQLNTGRLSTSAGKFWNRLPQKVDVMVNTCAKSSTGLSRCETLSLSPYPFSPTTSVCYRWSIFHN